MACNLSFLTKLLEGTDPRELENPELLYQTALGLLYPVYREELIATPPLYADQSDDDDGENITEAYKTIQQEEQLLQKAYLQILARSWLLLVKAELNSSNPTLRSECQLERALLLERLILQKTHPVRLAAETVDRFAEFIQRDHYSLQSAEQLITCSAESGNVLAQIYSIRRLLVLIPNRQPLQPVTKKSAAQEAALSWIEKHPVADQVLKDFSAGFLAVMPSKSRLVYNQALNEFLCEHRSLSLRQFIENDQHEPAFAYLIAKLPDLKQIESEWRKDRNIALLTKSTYLPREALKHNVGFRAVLFERGASQPDTRPSVPQAELERRQSLPVPQKPNEEGVRDPNPRDFIFKRKRPLKKDEQEKAQQLEPRKEFRQSK